MRRSRLFFRGGKVASVASRWISILLIIFCFALLTLVSSCDSDDNSSTSSEQGDDDQSDDDDSAGDDDNDTGDDDDTIFPDDDDDDDDDDVPVDPDHPSTEVGVFVAVDGNDDAPGTMEQPVASITRGLTLAADAGKVVFVAQGLYREAVYTTVSLYGGYRTTDWQRDPQQFVTHIKPTTNSALVVDGAARGQPVTVDGFNIVGAVDDLHVYGVVIEHGPAILSANTIACRSISHDSYADEVKSYGVYVQDGAQVTITGNDISGGPIRYTGVEVLPYGFQAAGIYVQEAGDLRIENNIVNAKSSACESLGAYMRSGAPLITGNSFQGGTGYVSRGLLLADVADAVIINNEIVSGIGMDSAGMFVSGEALLINNTVQSNIAQEACAMSLAGDFSVINNVIKPAAGTERIGICLDEDTQIDLLNNDILAPGFTDAYLVIGDENVRNIAAVNDCVWTGCRQAADNLADDPALLSLFDRHLSEFSPCIDAGIDPSPWYDGPAIFLDYDGDTRPQGDAWDIGMDELNEILLRVMGRGE